MIWLGYPEEDNGAPSSPAMEDAKGMMEEVTEANERIDDHENELILSLETLDKNLKKEEKEEWIALLHLGNSNSDQSWLEIKNEFHTVYSRDELGGDAVPEAFCTGCGTWIATGGSECAEHGGGENIVLVHDVNRMEEFLVDIGDEGEMWEYNSNRTPFGRFSSTLTEKVELIESDPDCSRIISEFEIEVGKVVEGMDKLKYSVEEMRTTESPGAESSSEIKDYVKGMRSLRINTVENVTMNGKRWLVEHRIPGRSGVDSGVSASIIQDMGRMPMRISFRGILSGEEATFGDNAAATPALKDMIVVERLELLKRFFKLRSPLYFASNFINRADLATKVLIEDLRFEEEQIVNHRVAFECTLIEYSDVHWEGPGAMEEQMKGIREGVDLWSGYRTLDIVTSYRTRYVNDPRTLAVTHMITGRSLK